MFNLMIKISLQDKPSQVMTLNTMHDKFSKAFDDLGHLSDKDATLEKLDEICTSYEYAKNWLNESTRYQGLVSPFVDVLKLCDSEMSKSGMKNQKKRFEKLVKQHEKRLKNPCKKKVDLDSMTAEEYREYRKNSFKALNLDMYPHKFGDMNRISVKDFIARYNYLSNEEILKDPVHTHTLMGQILYKRSSSKKLYFYTIESDFAELQVMANLEHYGNNDDRERFTAMCELVCRGDQIGVKGYPHRSKSGELTILCESFTILSPCLEILPKVGVDQDGNKISKFSNIEARYRRRAQDFKINFDKRMTIKTVCDITRHLREYFYSENFLETPTPILSYKASGASAKPFTTFCNDAKQDMRMRIAPELNLKRLVVGGFERVFEIGKQFRNESMDLTHSPEFTSCEFYEKGADYYDVMKRTEDILVHIVKNVKGTLVTNYGSRKIDWTPPYKRIDIMEELPKAVRDAGAGMGVTFEWPKDMFSEEATEYFKNMLDKLGVECEEPSTIPRMLDKLIGEYLEVRCSNPTFLINHPQAMSPLAKPHRSIPQASERFELFVMEKELCNAFTELNDPEKQLEFFLEQVKDRNKGDEEAPDPDYNYITALRTGLPPCGGWGMGMDRLAMFVTDNMSIREVQTFPVIKPE